MGEELKPCPFCGGAAGVQHMGPLQWRVICQRTPWPCFARGPIASLRRTAVSLWNRRAFPKVTRAEAERSVKIVRRLTSPKRKRGPK